LPAAKMGVGTMWPLCGTVVDLVGKSWRKSGLTGPPRYEKLAGSDLANAVGHWLPSSKSRFGYRFRSVRSPRIEGRNIRNHIGGARTIGSLLLRQYERVSDIGRAIVLAVFADE